MENEYLITADGQIYPLATYGAKVTGLGGVPVEYQTAQGYKQHGVTVRDFRLQSRTLSIAFTLDARGRRRLWALRDALAAAVSPARGMLTYRKVLPDGRVREIRGWADESLSVEDVDDGCAAQVGLSLLCPDPSFVDPAWQAVTAENESSSALVLPFVMPDEFWFGGSSQYVVSLDYPGTWRGYPQLALHGPYDSATLSNLATGAQLVLGRPVPESSLVRVDTTPGAVNVTRDGVSSMAEVSDGNLVDFYLAPGANRLVLNGTGFNAATALRVEYRARYIAL
ncbi:phage tail domain-containing protein [Aggregatilinea lenta]|uniref:phage tail domain-containing protein n=1 Tax=Aggregatilinea lenta TaxID=913108 RepID=UPI000E5B4F8E|nr:phage tail domain-containing protein [Aggregatilinea lenta]